jgi:hypothetical protein
MKGESTSGQEASWSAWRQDDNGKPNSQARSWEHSRSDRISHSKNRWVMDVDGERADFAIVRKKRDL